MVKRSRSPLGFLPPLLAALLASCSVTPPAEINEIYREVLEKRQKQYQIKDGDNLVVKFYSPKHAELNQTEVIVLPDGKADLFFMDSFPVAGKTVPELEAEIRARVAGQAVDPEINIQVKPRVEKIHTVGDFLKPGSFDLTTGMTLQEAISMAGGMRATGDTDWALLRRPYMNPRLPDRFRIDLNDESEELILLPGDQIYLGKNALGTIVYYIQEFITAVFPNPFNYWSAFMSF